MIQMKHFRSERTDGTPNWRDVETYLNQFDLGELTLAGAPSKPRAQILQMKAYPSGAHHNIVIMLSIENTEAKQV